MTWSEVGRLEVPGMLHVWNTTEETRSRDNPLIFYRCCIQQDGIATMPVYHSAVAPIYQESFRICLHMCTSLHLVELVARCQLVAFKAEPRSTSSKLGTCFAISTTPLLIQALPYIKLSLS